MTAQCRSRGGESHIEDTRKFFKCMASWCTAVNSAEKASQENNNQHSARNFTVDARIAKFYLDPNSTKYQRWHDKLGHVGGGVLARCGVDGLKIPKNPYRCEFCIKGKMHRLGHSKNTHPKTYTPPPPTTPPPT